METKHTPGPWTAGWIGNVGEPGLGRPCVGTSGAADWVGPEGAEADARLIAAAPDLLDFVRRVVADAGASVRKGTNGMPELCGGLDPAILLDEFLRHGRKAIARATGGAR